MPSWISFFTPIIFGFLGLHYIRIEFSGNNRLDKLNKNINSSSFNAILTLLIIFVLIQNIPPLLNWLIFNADFIGTSKAECSREGACWIFIYVWIERLMYGLNIIDQIPSDFVKISESGINNPDSVVELKKAGFDGFLIGEYFMKSDSPNDLANKFINLVENEI